MNRSILTLSIAALAALTGPPAALADDTTRMAQGPIDEIPIEENLSDEFLIEEIMVRAIRDAQARAIDQERQSDNIITVLSSDSIGRFPDGNIAEALARVPGLAVDRGRPIETGEGKERVRIVGRATETRHAADARQTGQGSGIRGARSVGMPAANRFSGRRVIPRSPRTVRRARIASGRNGGRCDV